MKKLLIACTLAALTTSFLPVAKADNGGLESLRSHELNVEAPAEPMKKFTGQDTIHKREFVQQPPLIPHAVRGYQVDKDVNTCLKCHSWNNAAKWGATRISVTHFYDRNGVQRADVAPNRYFCLQCHVTQADAKPLKENDFKPVESLDKK